MRRVLQERIDLQEVVKNLIRAKAIREEQCGEVMGPVALMLHHMKALGWTLSDRLAITRRLGTTMHLTKGEEQLFDHWLREDLRRTIWGQGRSSEEQRRSTRNCRNKH